MKVKQFLEYLEKIPVEREELLDMDIKIKVPAVDGVHTHHTAIRELHVVDETKDHVNHLKHPECYTPRNVIEVTTTFGV